eukprot:15330268-Ditylum_brightwellii.AAC.3
MALTEYGLNQGCRLGMDFHADTMCVGKHAMVLVTIKGKTCPIYLFNKKYKPMKQISIVNSVVAHDCPETGQARDNDVIIEDVPEKWDPDGKS